MIDKGKYKDHSIITYQPGFQESFVRSNVDFVIGGAAMGVGKLAPLDSHVLTPNGWEEMGNIKVGSIIMTPFDGPTEVTHVFPQGVKDIYELTTDDGRKCECGLEHLWTIRSKSQLYSLRKNPDKWGYCSTVETKDIIDMLEKGIPVYLPINKALPFEEKDYVIPPYALGCSLGTDERIPEEYLFGSIDQRTQLLLGLSSTICDDKFTYSTSNNLSADDYISLCRSLGYVAIKHNKNDVYLIEVFPSDHVRIVSIEKTRSAEAQCIVVDNPKHLYICDDYITTHNSYAALLMAAEPALDPNFRMVYIRKNIQDTKVGGSGTDEIQKIYGDNVRVKISENPRAVFPSGAFIDFTHMNDERPENVLERIRGWQYSVIYFDEGTGFEWSTIRLAFSRNRGSGKWNGKIRITCNPKKNHWLRTWLDWYIDPVSGFPIPERNGVVRYFYIKGDNIKDVVFGDTPEEVYEECKYQISSILKKLNSNGSKFTYKDLIKTTTFYGGSLDMNKELLKTNPGYLASVAAMGEKQALANLQGNWNVDILDETDSPIPSHVARESFNVDPQVNGDKWITADLADYGTDNFVILVWDGLHIIDILILGDTTPARNATELMLMAAKHDIPDSHIIFDATNGRYILDYIEDAVPFISAMPPVGLYSRGACNRKDEAYLRLKFILNNRKLSWAPELASTKYTHQKLRMDIFIETEFIEECSVVRFIQQPNGRKRLANKKDMNQMLGKGRSMDILDAVAMRMFPLAEYQYGTELESTAIDRPDIVDEDSEIYKDEFWA